MPRPKGATYQHVRLRLEGAGEQQRTEHPAASPVNSVPPVVTGVALPSGQHLKRSARAKESTEISS
jgi:hypothetical protein